jgi:hypothetical protein
LSRTRTQISTPVPVPVLVAPLASTTDIHLRVVPVEMWP